MTEYKVVPVEADTNMVQALKDRIMVTNRGGILNAGHAITAALAASPDTGMVAVPRELLSLIEQSWRIPPPSPGYCPPSEEAQERIREGLAQLRTILEASQ